MKGNLKQVASRITLFLRDLPASPASIEVWKTVSQEYREEYAKHYLVEGGTEHETHAEAHNWLGTVNKVDEFVEALQSAKRIRDELREHIELNHLVY